MDNKIVTIDLGTRKLGVCVAQKGDDGRNEILCYNEFPSDGILHGKVVNPSKLSAVIKRAVEDTERFLSLKISDVMVQQQKYDIREEDKSFTIDVSGSDCITEENIKNLADMVWDDFSASLEEDEEVFGVVAQSFDIGGEIFIPLADVVGRMGSSLTGHYKVYVGKRGNAAQVEAAFSKAGIKIVKTVFIPELIGDSVLSESEKYGGVALIDMGAGATSVSIFYAGALRHYSAIPFGGDSITADIRNMCGISERLAENIKLGFGGCMPDHLLSMGDKKLKITDKDSGSKTEISVKYLSEIITARVAEIVNAILYEIQKSGLADKLKNGVVLTGGCAQMLNLKNYLKEVSGYSSRIGTASRSLFKADNTFYTATSTTTAGLVSRFSAEDVNCTEDMPEQKQDVEVEEAKDLSSIFNEEDIADSEDTCKLRKEEKKLKKERERQEKEEKKQRREEEKRQKEMQKRLQKEQDGDTLFGFFDKVGNFIMGGDDDKDNKLI